MVDPKRGKLVDAMRRHISPSRSFDLRSQEDGLPHVVQLQTADFLAYEVRKIERRPERTKAVEDHRISLRN